MKSDSTLHSVGGLPANILPWVLVGLIAIAGAVFLSALWPKLKMLRLAAPDNRFGNIPARVGAVIRIAFGQSKMFKDKGPGWMHALIFWGFLILLIRAGGFFLWGLFPGFFSTTSESSTSVLELAYYPIKNGVVVLLCYFLKSPL